MHLKLYTDLTPDECINILTKNLKGIWDCDEYYGKVVGNEFWVRHVSIETSVRGYSPPMFEGRVLPDGKRALIEGSFTKNRVSSILRFLGSLWVIVLAGAFFVLALWGLIQHTSFVSPGGVTSNVVLLIFCFVSLVAAIAFPKYCRHLRARDIEKIRVYLLTKLNVTEKTEY